MLAAVSDYVPAFKQEGKLKKEMLGESWSLEMKQNRDILSSINKEGITVVGFKAEMDKQNALTNATNMLKNKNLDGVCLNILEDSNSFGGDTNAFEFITETAQKSIPTDEKLSLALSLLTHAKALQE